MLYLAMFVLVGFAQAQTQSGQFEVTSVKPAALGGRGMRVSTSPGGTLTVSNMDVKELIVIAYHVQPYQIVGASGWMESQRFDLMAKPDHKPKEGELDLMFQALLADRFGLVIHRETKELPIYGLVVAKSGKLGPGLVPATEGSCVAFDRTNPPAPSVPGTAPPKYCGSFMMSRTGMAGTGVPIATLVNTLSRSLGRTVVDQTGLSGSYNINLEFTPEDNPAVALPTDGPKPPPTDVDSAIFTALQEQLGLKAVPQKGPVQILVIDKVKKPEEN